MFTGLIGITKETLLTPIPISFCQVILSLKKFVIKKPHEDFNFQRNFKSP
jgi:hypothetical protein